MAVSGIPAWLVGAKVRPPRVNAFELERLPKALQAPLNFITVLEAPAGFGKTTLLNQARLDWEARGGHSLWLTVSRDEGPKSFEEYLGFAASKAGLELPDAFWEETIDDQLDNKRFNLLVNAIETAGGDWLFLLDDGENLNKATAAAFEYFIEVAPPNLFFAIAGRSLSGLSLARVELQGQLSRLEGDETAFSAHDICALLGGAVTARQADDIHTATLGWPIAVQLINMDLRAGKSLTEALGRLGSPNETASSYIREQIETRLPVELRSALLDASVLDWIEPSALLHIVGENNLLSRLGELGEATSLIVQLDADITSFRMHPLLKDHLQVTLQREDLDRYRSLHKAAARWMASNNRFRLALTHAYSSDDPMLVGELVEYFGGIRLFIQEGVTRVFGSQIYLNDKILEMFPRVALMQCAIQTKKGKLSEARSLYLATEKRSDGFTKDRTGGEDESLRIDHGFCLPFLVLYGCLPADRLGLTDQESMPEVFGTAPLVNGAYNNVLCVSNFIAGKLEDATRRGMLARRAYETCQSAYGQMYIDLHEGAIALNRGDLSRASGLYEVAQKRQRRHFRGDEGARLACDVLLLEQRLLAGEFKGVDKTLLDIAHRLVSHEAWLDLYALAISNAVEYFLYRDRPEEARSILDTMRKYVVQEGLMGLDAILASLCAVVDVFEGHASTELDGFEVSVMPWRIKEIILKSRCLVHYYGGGTPDGLDGILEDVDDLVISGLYAPAFNILIMAACAAWRTEQQDLSVNLFGEASRLGVAGVGLLYRYRKESEALVSRLLATAPSAELAALQYGLKKLCEQDQEPFFSRREKDVLQELIKGKQDKVIARQLGVTEHAVRYHLKNIYGKLGVGSRYEAITKAQATGIA